MSIPPINPTVALITAGSGAARMAAAGFSALLESATAAVGRATESDTAKLTSTKETAELPASRPVDRLGRSDLRRQLQKLADRFRTQLNERLEEIGVDTSQPFRLQFDSFGQVTVAGDHPEKRRIEQVINSDTELQNLFQTLANRSLQAEHPGRPDNGVVTGSEFSLLVAPGEAVMMPAATGRNGPAQPPQLSMNKPGS